MIEMTKEERIRQLREKSTLSQSEFADKVGVPLGTLRNWEQGRRVPPDYVVALLETVFEKGEETDGNTERNETE